MARPTKSRRTWSDDDDDDEFPDIDALVRRKVLQSEKGASATHPGTNERPSTGPSAIAPVTVRRRRLGTLSNNLLLRAWTPDSGGDEKIRDKENQDTEARRTRVELRTRKTRPAVVVPPSPDDQDEYVSAQEEATIIEEVSMMDGTFHSCDSESSEFRNTEDEDEDEDVAADAPPRRPPAKPRMRPRAKGLSGRGTENTATEGGAAKQGKCDAASQRALNEAVPKRLVPDSAPAKGQTGQRVAKRADKELADTLSHLRLDEIEDRPRKPGSRRTSSRETTPPVTPPKSRPGLVSPKKLPRIPVTPHRPGSDMFWSQEFIDDWNDEHSPRKQLFPDALAARQKSPTKSSPEKQPHKSAKSKNAAEREARKSFEKAKHDLAEKFLHELDAVITDGKLAELAASTGGIKLVWTNKLNTTAGRANWKRETIRTRGPNGTAAPATDVKHRHHASIELAEKVIDDEHRLLNVIAHEFCHLANFMVSGVANNPHGREFKAWAAQCSRAFGHRGIEVTTKHSYDIDFKYVWQCVACGMEFKRHSKSIDPARHRCGSCRSELQQTKPVPRKAKDGSAPAKVSEYQAFVKEQMRLVKEENPKSPQKEIMKIVAGRWAAQRAKPSAAVPGGSVEEVSKELGELVV